MYVSLTVVCLYLCVSVGVCLPACSSICRLVSRSTGQSELSCAGRSVGHSVRGGGGGGEVMTTFGDLGDYVNGFTCSPHEI